MTTASTTTEQTTPNATTTAAPPAQAAAPAAEQPTTPPAAPAADTSEPAKPAPPAKERKVHTLTSDAFKDLKAKERERGRREAEAALDEAARKLGFKSHADMVEAAKRAKAKPATTAPAATSKPTAQPPQAAGAADAAEAIRQANARGRELKKTRAELRAVRAEMVLRESAARAGVQDVDYAMHLLRGEYKKLDEAGLEAFDEDKFFAGLRATHPHLFAVEQKEATTGVETTTGGGAPPKPPVAGNGGTAPVDARKLTPQQFNERLKSLGIKNPAAGTST